MVVKWLLISIAIWVGSFIVPFATYMELISLFFFSYVKDSPYNFAHLNSLNLFSWKNVAVMFSLSFSSQFK